MTQPNGQIKWMHDGTKATEGEVLQLLFALVSATKPLTCLETGTFTGAGTKAIALALENNGRGRLTTVEFDDDLYKQYDLDSLPRTKFVHGDSLLHAQTVEAVDFAFVDCGEPEHRLRVAIELKPKTKGLLLMHDTVFYPDLLGTANGVLGPCSLHIPTLHGLTIWDCS
jgi:predicted O-methyltransferase YrrM